MPPAFPPFTIACATRELPRGADWLQIAAGLRARPGFWWLDSARVDARLGRFSYAGAEPLARIRALGERCERAWLRAPAPEWAALAGRRERRFGDPLLALAEWLPRAPAPDPPLPLPFAGGAVGWLGYELAERLEALPAPPADGLTLPDVSLALVDACYAVDHLDGRVHAAALGFAADAATARARAEEAALRLAAAPPAGDPTALRDAPPAGSRAAPRCTASRDAASHAKAVARVLEHVVAGDVYQACLTHRVECDFAGDPWRLYLRLRAENPAPFAAYLDTPDAVLLSCSPERFLALGDDRWAESRPIKGTRPRDPDPARDRAQRDALARSEKDRAENLMIVDLVRNDLGRVCETGSVHVPELMSVEGYASVWQLVSTVRGRLREGCDALDLLRAAFPPGSMTGAPKLAAMRLLAALEPVRRGPYAGAIGFLDARGGCGLAVAIRTLLLRGGRAWLHSGGGIVADSDAAAEWQEAASKVRPLLDALAAEAGA